MLWRRGVEVSAPVVAWRAGRDDVREVLLREGVPAVLGPSAGGWTVVRLLVAGDAVVEPREREVVDLVDDVARTLRIPGLACLAGEWGARRLVACSGSGAPVAADLPALGSDTGADRPSWAAVLQAAGAGHRLEPAMDVVTRGADAGLRGTGRTGAAMRDRRPLQLAEATGLPPHLLDHDLVGDPEPVREAVYVPRVDPRNLHVAASAVALPLRAAVVDDDALVTAEPPDATALLPVAAFLAAGRRQSAVVAWRQGEARGYQLVRGGSVEDSHVWSTAWEFLPLHAAADDELREQVRQGLAPPEGDAALVLERLGTQGADPADLRALLRRPPGPDVLARFCDLTGLPRSLADVLEGADPATLPGSRVLAPAPFVRSALRAATTPDARDPWIVRVGNEKPWWIRVGNLVWAVVAVGWAVRLWPGGTGAKVAAVALAATAVVSVVSALRPGKRVEPPRSSPERT
jgi:hypothetical protein